jgi:hypothetical protein
MLSGGKKMVIFVQDGKQYQRLLQTNKTGRQYIYFQGKEINIFQLKQIITIIDCYARSLSKKQQRNCNSL